MHEGETNMTTEYRVVYLTPGQQSPVGSTGICLSDGGIVWEGEEGSFVGDPALQGHHLPTDPVFSTEYTNSIMTEEQIEEYNTLCETTISGLE